ncbi:MAG: hypothetical protein IJS09_05265 [Treponema sp.]|nr:hypothetical protein [Treponema sp.]
MQSASKTLYSFIVVCAAVVVNVLLSLTASSLRLPLYFDSLLTLCVTALCGLVPGLICAVFTNVLLTLYTASKLTFALCHIVTVLLAWLTFHHRKKQSRMLFDADVFLWAGLWSALSNSFLGSLISGAFFASAPGPSMNTMVQGIYFVTQNLPLSVGIAGSVSNLTDKMISAVLSFAVYRLIEKKRNTLTTQ